MIRLILSITVLSSFVFADCKYEEGDDIVVKGKYMWADSCKIHGTVEKVNKKCTKVKVSIGKVTAAFGMRVNAECRYNGGQGAAGQTVWIPIN